MDTALVAYVPITPMAIKNALEIEDVVMTTLEEHTPMNVKQILALIQMRRPQTTKTEVNSFLYKHIKTLKRIEIPGVAAPLWALDGIHH
jgi:hypothetical protein